MSLNAESLSARRSGLPELSPEYDPWDPIRSLRRYGRHVLTSVELTVSHLCNMRCEHCAVGHTLVTVEPEKLPLDLILRRLDEVEHLETISITGGEPTFSEKTVREFIIPLLKYARSRNLRSQLNSNLTLDYGRYEMIAPWLDVMHITYNYTSVEEFHRITFGAAPNPPSLEAAARLYERMVDNAQRLAKGGLFVSAESMINYRTHRDIVRIHRDVVEMGCRRHEVHPMYPSSFAKSLPMLSKAEMMAAIERLIEHRDPNVWMLFGTLPFYRCSPDPEERRLARLLTETEGVTVRNDPDGRNRLNVNVFTGDVFVTDFADVPPFGNIREERLDDIFERWLDGPLARSVNCHCPEVGCCGPNLLVKSMYYADVDFTARRAIADA
ncbi:MAG: radical SAM/CxCxxxxC motif protein YfkAB [Thermobacillus sp. ZCTH02-B1]|uniref:radical SAM/CxCxxxxC motif protein YfkAB n=1 Tax=Thermobacillus sp. ZCTH02-B1 TaxID=1858795 RepID=UPI000B54FA84|nr:radical SAM/CxCxxxxC motif protein YfkAB [Thermobacillus sp. ZCTH02-B1]OUM96151.1 MAG: radical SAM/CxCxxxxC motif protein YfkAB [Thermobacillus sp. ZCTH02-B1]